MKNANFGVALLLSCVSGALLADEAATVENELVAEDSGRGRWTFSAGPSWRSRVSLKTHGTLTPPAATPRSTTKRDMTDAANWTNPSKVADPKAGTGGIPAGAQLWSVTDTRTEVYGAEGSDFSAGSSEERRPLGLTLQAGYDVYQAETWSVSLNLRFAGYWNMKSSTRRNYNAGSTVTETWTDSYLFPGESPDEAFDPDPDYADIESNGSTLDRSVTDTRGSRRVATRFRGDLYQIGFGPKITWSPFKGWCDRLAWLDVYGGAEVLCNIAYSRFSADGASNSETDCLLGFGGEIGLVGNLTENLGLYGQVGYEWIDDTDIHARNFRAELDYSSLILSAGLIYRF